ncbi:hypothetical protein [Hymenobacter edaphi]|uniref:Lipoprotein n=1 Tax=Hymenobacter edaphi TaxID=2211146 RepID=A0A328BQR2_9BACT|nr:hypothetical protein [Hymenobacter edaphi]RAK69423.1 hypothetical protein DLM85_00725 [Hymenobacter edaphi]
MRTALFLPAALLLLGCQPQPDPQATAQPGHLNQLTQLQHRLQTQQDTLRRLRRRLDSTQRQLEETALAANALLPAGTAPAPGGRLRPAQVPAGTLYGKPAAVALADTEMAEVLSLADSTSSGAGPEFSVKAYRVCNGPADATLEFCNCSHYVYLALDTGDLPYEYRLYRVGPFYQAQLAGWAQDGEQPVLRIRHDIKGRRQTDAFRIGWKGVQRL